MFSIKLGNRVNGAYSTACTAEQRRPWTISECQPGAIRTACVFTAGNAGLGAVKAVVRPGIRRDKLWNVAGSRIDVHELF